ncbi:MAG: MarR family winged helix-turn-helix transcriptional regulator [Desulfobacteraceae bacterium]|jgi:DNA-binding MarR family transcriptional regulator
MKGKVKSIINVMVKLDDIYIQKIQDVGKCLSMKDPFGELTNTQSQAVFKISRICPCTLSEVAKCLKTTKSAASTLVERLVVRGVLERKQDPDNRRRVLITLTLQAQRFQKALEEELEMEMIRIADHMNPDDFNMWVKAYEAIGLAIDDIYGSKEQ